MHYNMYRFMVYTPDVYSLYNNVKSYISVGGSQIINI